MKARTKTKIDWMIHAISDEEQRNNPEAVIDFVTSGYDKYGYCEIVVVGKVKNADYIGNLINTFGRMLAEGEVFDEENHHFIDSPDGKKEFEFDVLYGEYEDSTKFIQLIPTLEDDILDVDLDMLDEGIYYFNRRPWVLLFKNGKKVLVRQDKLVYKTIKDNTLDEFDDSWELDYKDGNYKNCAIDNLYRVK